MLFDEHIMSWQREAQMRMLDKKIDAGEIAAAFRLERAHREVHGEDGAALAPSPAPNSLRQRAFGHKARVQYATIWHVPLDDSYEARSTSNPLSPCFPQA